MNIVSLKNITDRYVKVPSGIFVNSHPGVLTLSINPNLRGSIDPDDINLFGAVLYNGTTKIDIYDYNFIGVRVYEYETTEKYRLPNGGESLRAPEYLRIGHTNYIGLYVDEYNDPATIEMECCVAQVPESYQAGQSVITKPKIVTDVNTDKIIPGNTYAILARVPHLPWFYAFCYNNVRDMKERGEVSAKFCLFRAAEYVAKNKTPFWPDKKSLQYMMEYQKLKGKRQR